MIEFDENGREIPDPVPLEMPLGYEHPETLEQMIARMVNVHSQIAQDQGLESFEEADDFDVNDDEDIQSPYQYLPMHEEVPVVERRKIESGSAENSEKKEADKSKSGVEKVEEGSKKVSGKPGSSQMELPLDSKST